MDLDCAFKFGLNREFIKESRKHWSLADDVRLLKYLEKFSQNLISQSSDALQCVEDFEKDLYFVSLNIQTLSQRFQSLANKQFVEHCVLEDDILSYSKPSEKKIDIAGSSSNHLLTNALSTCLTSFHFKCMGYKDGSNDTLQSRNSDQSLPPLIGTQDFNNFYENLLNSKENLGELMKMSKVNAEDNFSDKQSLQDTITLCSSSNVVPDIDFNNCLYENNGNLNDDASTSSSISHEKFDKNQVTPTKSSEDINNKPVDTTGWVSQENSFFTTNSYDSLIPHQNHSLFDDEDEGDDDDLFIFAKSKSFPKSVVNECDVIVPSDFKDVKTNDESDREAIHTTKNKIFDSTNPPKVSNDDSKEKAFKNINSCPNIADKTCDNGENNISTLQSSLNFDKTIQGVLEQNKARTNKKSGKNVSPLVNDSENEAVSSSSKPDMFKSSLKVSDSTKVFSLFSDQEESDDELFSSIKQKHAKENFKKVLEEKIAGIGINKDNIKSAAKKSIIVSSSNESDRNEDASKSTSLNFNINIHGEESSLPDYNTSMLHCLVKSRPKIRNKRRPPSRKHLKGLQSNNSNVLDNSNTETTESNSNKLFDPTCNNTLSVISPSTEEEDLFIVPTIPMPHEPSCSNLFIATSLFSPGSSLDNHNLGSEFDCKEKVNADGISHNSSIKVTERSEYGSSMSKNDTIFSSGISPTNVTITSNEDSNENIKGTSNAFWNNIISLFNDSEEDEDDLFSYSGNKKTADLKTTGNNSNNCQPRQNIINNKPDHDSCKDIFSNDTDDLFSCNVNKKTADLKSIKNNSNNFQPSQNIINNKSDPSFKDIFCNDTDDDDLFKIKETATLSSVKNDSSVTKVRDEKLNSRNESYGNKLIKANTTDFKDPLSSFSEHLAD